MGLQIIFDGLWLPEHPVSAVSSWVLKMAQLLIVLGTLPELGFSKGLLPPLPNKFFLMTL